MKRLLGGIFLALVIGVPAYAALKAGGAAPDFSTKASLAGKEFDYSLKAALAKGPVVVYFYPSAFTGGCNIEAHTFAETKDKFEAAGATVIGVSRDSIARLNAFSADPQYCAGKLAVASDADGSDREGIRSQEQSRQAGLEGLARRGHRPRLHGADDLRDQAGSTRSRRRVLVGRRQDHAGGPRGEAYSKRCSNWQRSRTRALGLRTTGRRAEARAPLSTYLPTAYCLLPAGS